MTEVVAVLGAGIMGRGIAQVAAAAGFDVRLRDVDPRQLNVAINAIKESLDKGVHLGKLSAADASAALQRIRPLADAQQAVTGAAWIIEAVPERLELKQTVFREVDALVDDAAILATNTSGLSVTRIGAATRDPGRVVGLHFFNPPHLLKLLEVVRGATTRPEVVEKSLAFARRLGKQPIVVQDSPGFASSRLGVVLGLEAIRMLEQGVASAQDIDTAMELGYNHPMGPLKLTDLVGLDVRLAIADHLHRELGGEQYRAPALLRQMVAEGRLGKKSGRGFYQYDGK
jgi:3-hydroxybutyryl-CoA dehydrogenase